MKSIIALVLMCVLAGCSRGIDRTRKAERLAVPSSEYPLAGFWKEKPSYEFGLAIAPAGNGFYSISFCGPGGCFKPGTYRPNSKIYGDTAYKVIDANTIDVLGAGGLSRYYRFPSRTATQPVAPPNGDEP